LPTLPWLGTWIFCSVGRYIRLNPDSDVGASACLFADTLDRGPDGYDPPRGPTWSVRCERHLSNDYGRFGVRSRKDQSGD
jgi:hypothetical protein